MLSHTFFLFFYFCLSISLFPLSPLSCVFSSSSPIPWITGEAILPRSTNSTAVQRDKVITTCSPSSKDPTLSILCSTTGRYGQQAESCPHTLPLHGHVFGETMETHTWSICMGTSVYCYVLCFLFSFLFFLIFILWFYGVYIYICIYMCVCGGGLD